MWHEKKAGLLTFVKIDGEVCQAWWWFFRDCLERGTFSTKLLVKIRNGGPGDFRGRCFSLTLGMNRGSCCNRARS